ncbi:endolytic transglycosylase MltG [Marinobacter sp. X15-166B]|uniref:endolytic transglycosylase MltG n=1 Tax=Marinobacter sp. X15-166B TaxID=1897620 RepID=UPI001D172AE0|nr:endolytic transglycosylase MltG [Marinobacter sp. X15-166B]
MMRTLFLTVIGLVVLAGAGTGLWVWQGLQTLDQPRTLAAPVLFDVPPGSGLSRVAGEMEALGLIERSLWLRLYGRLHPEQARIKAGEYELTSGMTAKDMLASMVAGEVKHWVIRFIEGWTFKDVRAALASNERLRQTTVDWSDARIMEALGAHGQHPEGLFFPDTYLFTSKDSDLDLLRRSFARMEQVLAEEWANKSPDAPYKTPYEALIMASIIERETGVPHERGEIAGVFVRRLQKGMRLQTDPTVIYGMGDAYKGRITRQDLRTPTPYNTYTISGLPPTPIALSGREAIHAALHPADGNSLYFVARGDGSHKFSRTLREHQRAVREFQLNRRADYRSSPAAPVTTEGGTQ